jgi:GMP synthase (glutamine-hydrolysing)
MDFFDPKAFVDGQIKEIKRIIGNGKALIAVSGGVDSSTCAVLTHMAIGENLLCVILDDAFMREGEPEKVAEILSSQPLNLPVKIERVQQHFLNALRGFKDAEEKRRAFRETFYRVLGETARRERCEFLVQGTILADIIETKGGVKTQHNVLEQIGINTREIYGFKVVEPLASLLKWQVREVARYLKIPPEISERQPFPGPGLSVRVVGEIKDDKLRALKKATSIVEEKLSPYKLSQYFAAIMDNEFLLDINTEDIRRTAVQSIKVDLGSISVKIFMDKATGVKGSIRSYGYVAAVKCLVDDEIYAPPLQDLVYMQKKIIDANPSVTRVIYLISEIKENKPYSIIIRAVETNDFLTARVANVPWQCLYKCAKSILEKCPEVSAVYYDVTPKPPATIELE